MDEEKFFEIGEKFSDEYGSVSGQMFGKKCLKYNSKAFAASFQGEMVFKLGKDVVDNYKGKYAGSVNWDPSGKERAMKDWLQVPSEYADDWVLLTEEALEYIKSIQ